MDSKEKGLRNEIILNSSKKSPISFKIKISDADSLAHCFEITGTEKNSDEQVTRSYKINNQDHNVYLDFFQKLSIDFGLRLPQNRKQRSGITPLEINYREVLTENIHVEMLHGYGDPAVIRLNEEQQNIYYLLATSNDAPQSFPILRSTDLIHWEFVNFVFPKGGKPKWASEGEYISDYWAAEMHQFGNEFRIYFVARDKATLELCIGVATSSSPEGPFTPAPEPILKGNIIDPHVFIQHKDTSYLFWKEDNNDVWPRLIIELLHANQEFIPQLFTTNEDQITAVFMQTLWPWIKTRKAMERFFIMQILIESIISQFSSFYKRLESFSDTQPASIQKQIQKVLKFMKTPMYAQRLSSDGLAVVGERTKIIENDLEWEAHLVEGMWLTHNQNNYYLFYAGNDFSTDLYGIGVAIGKSPLGPFTKMQRPLLLSTEKWWSPGHPSVVTGPDGKPQLFLHAYFPGQTGYKKFRALLSTPLIFEQDRVLLG